MSHDYSTYDLETAKILGESEVEVWWTSTTQDIFDSSALGTMHRYWCGPDEQMRMINGALSKDSTAIMATPHPVIEPPTYSWTPHTARQSSNLHADYTAFVSLSYARYNELRALVAACTTVQQVQDLIDVEVFGQTLPV